MANERLASASEALEQTGPGNLYSEVASGEEDIERRWHVT